MLNLNKQKTLASNIAVTHYLTAAIMFLVIVVLIGISSNSFIGHYFHPRILAITHLTTLGWITLIIFGTLYQLIPIITNIDLYSIKLSFVTFFCVIVGTILLAISFWFFSVGFLIQLAAIITFIGVTLFAINMVASLQQSDLNNVTLNFIISAVLWLWLTAFIGTLLSFNLSYAFLPKEHLYYLKIHAHIGMLGWFLFLIIGVSSKLIPMFLLSNHLDTKKLNLAYYFLHIGLIGFVIDSLFFDGMNRIIIYLIILLIGVTFYALYLRNVFRQRVRRKLDIGLKHSLIAFTFISIPLLLSTLLNFNIVQDIKLRAQVSMAFGFSVFLGFISLLVMGLTFKILPFIIWLKKYQINSAKTKTPLPKNLYSLKLANIQLTLIVIGYLGTISGILSSVVLIIQLGSCLLIIAAIIYNINVFKIVFQKPKFY